MFTLSFGKLLVVVLVVVAAWRGYRRPDFPSQSWGLEGDALRALPRGPRVDLISRQCFGDFDLSFEWRLPVGGNSGLLP